MTSREPLALEIAEGDDADYVALIGDCVRRELQTPLPRDVFVVCVRDWFGPRWFGFARTVCHEIGIRDVLGDDHVRVPPFVPSRVLRAQRFVRDGDAYVETAFGPALHVAQRSADNRKRKVATWSDDGLFVWHAAAPMGADRGALMVYRTDGRQSDGWYTGLKKQRDGRWALADTRRRA